MKRGAICTFLSLITLVYAHAQTDYDISVFLDNIAFEKPRVEELTFYLRAGDKLLRQNDLAKANIFYDFAAALGSTEGFYGKAMTENSSLKNRYLYFAHNDTPESQLLLSALTKVNDDLSSALLIHDNLHSFGLSYISDPLILWMPSNAADSLFLEHNDSITFMIASLKEESGDRLGAIQLYNIAAISGNYEALLKTRGVGINQHERDMKEALVRRMEEAEEYISLHKYFANEYLTEYDYYNIRRFIRNSDEMLISLSLGIIKQNEAEEQDEIDRLAKSFSRIIQSRKRSPKDLEKSQMILDALNSTVSYVSFSLFSHQLEKMASDAKDRAQHADSYYHGEDLIPSIEQQLEDLDTFCVNNHDHIFSQEAIRFIKKRLKSDQKPWAKHVLESIDSLKKSPTLFRTMSDNDYYPLYESGMFSKVHHTQIVAPHILELDI